MHLGDVSHEVGRGQIGRKVVVFGRVADPRPHLGTCGLRVVSQHLHRAAVTAVQAEQ